MCVCVLMDFGAPPSNQATGTTLEDESVSPPHTQITAAQVSQSDIYRPLGLKDVYIRNKSFTGEAEGKRQKKERS